MNSFVRTLAATLLCAATLPLPAASQVAETVDSVISVTFLNGWRQENGMHYAGIQVDLAPGWKTFWRAPGDGGIPTSVSWEGSENLKAASVRWPRPVVFRTYGMRSVGYADRVVLPVHMETNHDGPIDVSLNMQLGICNEICMPVKISVESQLLPDQIEGMVPIRSALASQPRHVDAHVDCTITPLGDEYQLDIATNLAPLSGNAETSLVELDDRMIWISEPQFMRDDDWVMSSVRLIRQEEDAEIDLSTLRMTMITTTDAIEVTGCD